MSHSELKQLTRAEELFDDGKLDEALEILNDRSQFEGLNPQQKEYFQYIKGLILFYQWKHEELFKHGEEIFQEGQNLNENLQSVDGLFFIIAGLCQAEKFKEAIQKIENAEVLLGLVSNISKTTFIQKKARIRVLKGWINLESNNIDVAEKCLDWVLNSQNDLGNTFEIVYANLLKARLKYQGKLMYNLCEEYAMKAFSMAKQIKFNHFWIALCQLILGALYGGLGEIDISLKYHMKSLAIFRKIKNNSFIAAVLTNIGENYSQLGNFKLAMEYAEECLSYQEKLSKALVFPLSNLVELALELGDNELAQHYFNRLKNSYNQKKEGLTEIVYLSTKAEMLKNSSRIHDKAKAEKIFRKIIDTDTLWSQFSIHATVQLCDLLLSEYRFTNNNEVLDELNHFIGRLLTIAEKTRSYIYFSKAFMLKSKLALISFDMKAARRLLTQAQKIAENYGIKRLAMKISQEHDELLKQTYMWEKLKESNASLSERWKLAGLNEQMENMVKKRMIEAPKISEEDPVMILILTEGGNLLFSKKFMEDFSFEDDILGGFLTTINYVISEVFSEGLDRAVFGQYTLLMLPLQPFLVCYIYKGDSYYAHRKLSNFLQNIENNNIIWQGLQKFFQKSKSIQLDDIPLLESLITEIFVKKNIQ
ncbi:MAG: tetratricopeptide repeat protein [Promethearchaeota archaeon]|nr:MAG: tetratricopeptide repeat protein [Candidatus Lokiarchaeota archaeon]